MAGEMDPSLLAQVACAVVSSETGHASGKKSFRTAVSEAWSKKHELIRHAECEQLGAVPLAGSLCCQLGHC
eukprot:6900268-Alexandrium_andersonii.AAC.1